MIGKQLLRRIINGADRAVGLRALMREESVANPHPLAGDRAIEWSWVVSHLPKRASRVLDLGCVGSPLTGIASRLGHDVTAVDLREIEYEMGGVTFLQCDILDVGQELGNFDVIMNCSTIEHIGLEGRYGSETSPDGDLVVMHRLARMLLADGHVLLTAPIGRDGEFAPFHRVYGTHRLPRLLDGYRVLEEEYWHQDNSSRWTRCRRELALSTQGSAEHYALGLFVLAGAH